MNQVLLTISALLFLVSCTAHRSHWVDYDKRDADEFAIQPADKKPDVYSPHLHVIEYDDRGDAWERIQLNKACEAVLNDGNMGPVIVFIHGWRNDARESSPDLRYFNKFIKEKTFNKQKPTGIYIGWRGASVDESVPIVGALAAPAVFARYANRERVADNVGDVTLTADLWEIRRACLDQKRRMILVGHSFGGRIVERVMGPSLVSYYAYWRQGSGSNRNTIREEPTDGTQTSKNATDKERKLMESGRNQLLADLAIMVNPASDSLRARKLKMALYHWPADIPPAMISLSSKTDGAVETIFPISQRIKAINQTSFSSHKRVYKLGHHANPCSEKKEWQSEYTTIASGHHDKQVWGDVGWDSKEGIFYKYDQKNGIGLSNYAYLILNVEGEILSGHGGKPNSGGIFNKEMIKIVHRIVDDCVLEKKSYEKSKLYKALEKNP